MCLSVYLYVFKWFLEFFLSFSKLPEHKCKAKYSQFHSSKNKKNLEYIVIFIQSVELAKFEKKRISLSKINESCVLSV